MSKSKKLPYWQTTPCPSWCSGGHRASTIAAERKHFSRWGQDITLSQYPALVHDRRRDAVTPVNLAVYVEQEVREAEARVTVWPEHADLRPLDLTLAEAAKLGKALLRAVELAGGSA